MAMKKIKVWIVGYATKEAWKQSDATQIKCVECGHVLLDNKTAKRKGWEEAVWNLLNWGCWTKKKPKEVQSRLTHCNSDVILLMEGRKTYRCAESFGWGSCKTFDDAIQAVKGERHNLWPLREYID